MNPDGLLALPFHILEQLPLVYSFVLLVTRYFAMLMILPGIGLGDRGAIVRGPAACVLAYASLCGTEKYAALPDHWLSMLGAGVFELLFGAALGLLPLFVVAGVQTGAAVASTTMGLGAASLFDPTSGTTVPELARIFGDLTVIVFLAIGGHYAVIYAASGLGESFVPGGSFSISDAAQLLVSQTADVFRLGVMVSAPIVVALLLTQFVMGLISKVVPTVNIFIISFPLTIGIGLILAMLVLPEIVAVVKERYLGIGSLVSDLTSLRS